MMRRTQQQRGFTLVEMLVSLGLFSVVATMSVGTLLVLIDANARAQSMQLVMTNLSFSMDSMTRELRTGFNWYCGAADTTVDGDDKQDCSVADNAEMISLVESGRNTTGGSNFDERRINYYFDADYYGTGRGAILRLLGQGGTPQPLTGGDIDVDQFELVVTGTAVGSDGNNEQPNASIFIKGKADVIAGGQVGSREFALQTTVTQRLIDY